MKILGIALQRPSYSQFTASTVLGVGLWLVLLGVMHASGQLLTRGDAGRALVVVLWSCLAAQLGIRVGQGPRHLLLNVGVGALLLGAYQAAAWSFGG